MGSESPIVATHADGVLRLRMAAESTGNLLDDAMMSAIVTAMDGAKDARVVVLEADGQNFSIGRPAVKSSSGLKPADAGRVRGSLDMVHAINRRLREWPGATVAVVRGQAKGAAAGFAINCDVVLAEPDATLNFPEMTYNLPPALVASYLPNRLAPRIANYALLTSAAIDAQRALAWGIVHEVHSPDAIAARASELTEFLASREPGAIARCKRDLADYWNGQHAVTGPRGVDSVIEWLSRSN